MKKLFFIILVFILAVTVVVHAEEAPIVTSGRASIVIDASTGRILYENNIHEEMPMASTTKIMTALLAIENAPLDYVVKVPFEAQGIEGSSIYLKSSEEIKMIDLLYGLMLRSGNDAATAIAIELGGSVEDFATLMNKRAKELGANNTNFMNPHGLHHNEHYTTAHDLALITRAALNEPVFKEIVKTKLYVADRSTNQYFSNKNKFLRLYDGGDGVKTGFTKRAGRCLVSSATRNEMQFIAVTLDDPNWFNTTMELIDHCFENYVAHIQHEEGEALKTIPTINGKTNALKLVTSKKIIIPIKPEEEGNLSSVIEAPENIEAPALKGQKIGKVYTYLNDQLLDVTELVANEDIEVLTFKDKLYRFFRLKKN
ncbi:D-alanyl-D-alanine carboxypeptidase family protein [Alkaliphilus peptidifermentans]|uniref:serine-type D-Ala-D-Ala carboxypeptidase n=1 Tax=Alkaliphilus peptidifermentans DSM 18978 TaxID=1120976 RepID=A0A1G5KEX2_9FIRM|nr:D-alanyl-D-alanine carboxypeptidase family protein [Alkaliphilus peptidifermentans]SCY99153.1 D-alanyl-D-alanine carboxypeptidase (penicillin-binding protein 5/6) [Alkaliphilus peptidifermentans DSM 18978]